MTEIRPAAGFSGDRYSQDGWIYTGFLVLLAWVPLPLGSNRAWAWSVLEVWVYLLVICWLITFMRQRAAITPVFRAAFPIIVLLCSWLLWIVLQITPLPPAWIELLSPQAAWIHSLSPVPQDWITLSVDPYATQQALLKSLAYVLIFCLTLLLVTSQRRLKILAYVLIFSGLFQAVYGGLMTLSGLEYGFFYEKTFGRGMASGTFTNRNQLAGYLIICLPVGIGMMIASLQNTTGQNWQQRLRYILKLFLSEKFRLRMYLVMMVIALVMTHSRMGNAAFFASLLVAGTAGLLLSRHAKRPVVILLASLIIIDLFIVGTWFGFERVVERIEQTNLAEENRDEVFIYIANQWSDYKWTGSGLGSFYSVFPKYRGQDVSGYYNHAHNDYLEFATGTGIIGIILLSVVVVWSLAIAVIAQYRRHDPLMRGISFAAIMGIVAVMIHAATDFNLQIPAIAATFMVLLACAWLARYLKHEKSGGQEAPGRRA